MGTEALIGLALSAAGAGVNAYNQNQTGRRQEEEIARGIALQGQRQQDANAHVDQEVNAMKNSSPEASRASAANDFLEQLRRTRAQAVGGPGAGKGSSRYGTDTADAQSSVDSLGTRTANLLSRISAPLNQRQHEQEGFAQLNSDLGTIGRNSAADQFLTQLRLRQIRPNAGVGLLGDALSGAGTAVAGGDYGSGTKHVKSLYGVKKSPIIDSSVPSSSAAWV